MRAGRAEARRRGVALHRGEAVDALGDGWLIRDRGGFDPCPWAFDVARAVHPRAGDRALDLGCGTGVLMGALHQVHGGLRSLVGVELDATAADQARRNALLNGWPAGVVRADVRALPLPPAFDLVLTNPPFYPPGWGRQSADDRVARATHALHGDIGDFTRAAAAALKPHGEALFVYDAGHLAALLLAVDAAHLTAREAVLLDDDRGLPARVLLRARRGGAGLTVTRRTR